MNQSDIDTFIDTVRMFGRGRKYLVRFGGSCILISVYLNELSDMLIGETWSNDEGLQVKTFNGFQVIDINNDVRAL